MFSLFSFRFIIGDYNDSLPFQNNYFNAIYSVQSLTFCKNLDNLFKEVHRILKPGGINIFTVRHTGDGDYKRGKHIGEDLYENDGFIVHFFDKEKINQISKGFKIEDIFELHEGSFPRKLFVVTLRKK